MKIKKLKTGSSKHIQLKQLVCTHIYSKVGNKTDINESLFFAFFTCLCLTLLFLSKVRWRHSNVVTMEQMAESVKKSSRNGHNIPQVYTYSRSFNVLNCLLKGKYCLNSNCC